MDPFFLQKVGCFINGIFLFPQEKVYYLEGPFNKKIFGEGNEKEFRNKAANFLRKDIGKFFEKYYPVKTHKMKDEETKKFYVTIICL